MATVHTESALHRESGQRPLHAVPVVMFEETPQVREVSFDEEEMNTRWYNSGEYFFIKKEALSTVRRMSTTRVTDSDTVSTRGLEIVEGTMVRKRQENIDTAVSAVLLEQQKNGSDPEALSKLYHDVSKATVRESIENGTSDAKAVQGYLADTKAALKKDRPRKSPLKRARNMMRSLFSRKTS